MTIYIAVPIRQSSPSLMNNGIRHARHTASTMGGQSVRVVRSTLTEGLSSGRPFEDIFTTRKRKCSNAPP